MGGSTYRVENGWQKYSDKIHMLDLKKGVRFGKMPVNFTRTFRPVFQRVYDTAFPFSADDFHCYLDAAVDIERYFLFVHDLVYYMVQN